MLSVYACEIAGVTDWNLKFIQFIQLNGRFAISRRKAEQMTASISANLLDKPYTLITETRSISGKKIEPFAEFETENKPAAAR
jgi:hypothetical protein